MFSFLYHCQDIYRSWLYIYMSNTTGVLSEARTAYPCWAPEFTPGFLMRSVLFIFLAFCVVLSCVFTFWVPCCDVRYDLRIIQCSVRLYLQCFVGGFMSYLRYMYLCAHSGVPHILCCVFALFFFVLCILYCQFL